MFKATYTPCLKKSNTYRLISNLSIVSKLLERLAAKRLRAYLNTSGMLPRLQSAYHANHSTGHQTTIASVGCSPVPLDYSNATKAGVSLFPHVSYDGFSQSASTVHHSTTQSLRSFTNYTGCKHPSLLPSSINIFTEQLHHTLPTSSCNSSVWIMTFAHH